MKSKEVIIEELSEERRKLLRGALHRSAMNRIDQIDIILMEMEGDDSFRSHELEDNMVFIDKTEGSVDLGEGFGDQDRQFVSESFHDPDLDY